MQLIDLVPDLRPTILAARQVRDARNTLARFLPNTPVRAVSYRLGRRRRLDQTVPVRAIDAPATPIRRPGVVDVQGRLPAITPIVNLSEQDLTDEMVLAMQLAGVAIDWTDAVNASAAQAALTVDNTLELMRGQVLSTGVVSLQTDDGEVHEVDFEIPAGQKVTPATKWTDGTGASTGDPFRDLTEWHNNVYIDAAGSAAGAMLTTSRTALHLANRLQAAYPQQPVGSNALAGYLADRNLPPIVTYDRQLEAYDGTKTRVFPEGTIVFLPAADAPVGRTELGITQEAVQQVQRQILTAQQAPGVTIVTLGQDNPVQRAVKAAALGLPVLQDNDAIVIASGVFS
jgi:hypothetical protein